ncbi:hypothetical protein Hypma_010728 [Hypsizygus marmoreus]|uniref:Uncharacterized protein n=1 Tax=Hypsizygus marmoreus TaxID=39966 RepID=A0A369JLW4_HYPMA|nr:hypothetical protein Hypma_010728 [Hypsizygus marmoreus]
MLFVAVTDILGRNSQKANLISSPTASTKQDSDINTPDNLGMTDAILVNIDTFSEVVADSFDNTVRLLPRPYCSIIFSRLSTLGAHGGPSAQVALIASWWHRSRNCYIIPRHPTLTRI